MRSRSRPLCKIRAPRYRFSQSILVGVAVMAVDQELLRHRETWLGFARLMRWSVGIIVVILLLLAYFVV
jgi:hypothetical protein